MKMLNTFQNKLPPGSVSEQLPLAKLGFVLPSAARDATASPFVLVCNVGLRRAKFSEQKFTKIFHPLLGLDTHTTGHAIRIIVKFIWDWLRQA